MTAVNGDDLIAHPQAGALTLGSGDCFAGGVCRFRKPRNHCGRNFRGGAQQNRDQHKAQHQIHKRSGKYHQHSAPDCLFFECVGIFAGLILPLHGAESADGEQTKGIRCLPFPKVQELRSHTDGELVDLNMVQLRHDKMSELMNPNNQPENENRNQKRYNMLHGWCPFLFRNGTADKLPCLGVGCNHILVTSDLRFLDGLHGTL